MSGNKDQQKTRIVLDLQRDAFLNAFAIPLQLTQSEKAQVVLAAPADRKLPHLNNNQVVQINKELTEMKKEVLKNPQSITQEDAKNIQNDFIKKLEYNNVIPKLEKNWFGFNSNKEERDRVKGLCEVVAKFCLSEQVLNTMVTQAVQRENVPKGPEGKQEVEGAVVPPALPPRSNLSVNNNNSNKPKRTIAEIDEDISRSVQTIIGAIEKKQNLTGHNPQFLFLIEERNNVDNVRDNAEPKSEYENALDELAAGYANANDSEKVKLLRKVQEEIGLEQELADLEKEAEQEQKAKGKGKGKEGKQEKEEAPSVDDSRKKAENDMRGINAKLEQARIENKKLQEQMLELSAKVIREQVDKKGEDLNADKEKLEELRRSAIKSEQEIGLYSELSKLYTESMKLTDQILRVQNGLKKAGTRNALGGVNVVENEQKQLEELQKEKVEISKLIQELEGSEQRKENGIKRSLKWSLDIPEQDEHRPKIQPNTHEHRPKIITVTTFEDFQTFVTGKMASIITKAERYCVAHNILNVDFANIPEENLRKVYDQITQAQKESLKGGLHGSDRENIKNNFSGKFPVNNADAASIITHFVAEQSESFFLTQDYLLKLRKESESSIPANPISPEQEVYTKALQKLQEFDKQNPKSDGMEGPNAEEREHLLQNVKDALLASQKKQAEVQNAKKVVEPGNIESSITAVQVQPQAEASTGFFGRLYNNVANVVSTSYNYLVPAKSSQQINLIPQTFFENSESQLGEIIEAQEKNAASLSNNNNNNNSNSSEASQNTEQNQDSSYLSMLTNGVQYVQNTVSQGLQAAKNSVFGAPEIEEQGPKLTKNGIAFHLTNLLKNNLEVEFTPLKLPENFPEMTQKEVENFVERIVVVMNAMKDLDDKSRFVGNKENKIDYIVNSTQNLNYSQEMRKSIAEMIVDSGLVSNVLFPMPKLDKANTGKDLMALLTGSDSNITYENLSVQEQGFLTFCRDRELSPLTNIPDTKLFKTAEGAKISYQNNLAFVQQFQQIYQAHINTPVSTEQAVVTLQQNVAQRLGVQIEDGKIQSLNSGQFRRPRQQWNTLEGDIVNIVEEMNNGPDKEKFVGPQAKITHIAEKLTAKWGQPSSTIAKMIVDSGIVSDALFPAMNDNTLGIEEAWDILNGAPGYTYQRASLGAKQCISTFRDRGVSPWKNITADELFYDQNNQLIEDRNNEAFVRRANRMYQQKLLALNPAVPNPAVPNPGVPGSEDDVQSEVDQDDVQSEVGQDDVQSEVDSVFGEDLMSELGDEENPSTSRAAASGTNIFNGIQIVSGHGLRARFEKFSQANQKAYNELNTKFAEVQLINYAAQILPSGYKKIPKEPYFEPIDVIFQEVGNFIASRGYDTSDKTEYESHLVFALEQLSALANEAKKGNIIRKPKEYEIYQNLIKNLNSFIENNPQLKESLLNGEEAIENESERISGRAAISIPISTDPKKFDKESFKIILEQVQRTAALDIPRQQQLFELAEGDIKQQHYDALGELNAELYGPDSVKGEKGSIQKKGDVSSISFDVEGAKITLNQSSKGVKVEFSGAVDANREYSVFVPFTDEKGNLIPIMENGKIVPGKYEGEHLLFQGKNLMARIPTIPFDAQERTKIKSALDSDWLTQAFAQSANLGPAIGGAPAGMGRGSVRSLRGEEDLKSLESLSEDGSEISEKSQSQDSEESSRSSGSHSTDSEESSVSSGSSHSKKEKERKERSRSSSVSSITEK